MLHILYSLIVTLLRENIQEVGVQVLLNLYNYKKDHSNPKNYRETTLFPIFGKLFTQALANGITLRTKKHNIMCEAQFGFHKDRRTIDAMFILSSAISYANKNQKPIYLCFIDLVKAFDIVNLSLFDQSLPKWV